MKTLPFWLILTVTTGVHATLLWSVSDVSLFTRYGPDRSANEPAFSAETFELVTSSPGESLPVSTALIPSDDAPASSSLAAVPLPPELPTLSATGLTGTAGNMTPSVSLFQLHTSTRRVVYLIDASGSMFKSVAGRTRLDLACEEVARSLAELSPDTEFNVVFFADSSVAFSPRAVYATERAKAAARAFVRNVPDLAGDTNLAGGLARALQMEPDSLFLLTDGGANVPDWQVLAAARKLGSAAAVRPRIYAVGFDTSADVPANETLLRKLSAQNGGAYFPYQLR